MDQAGKVFYDSISSFSDLENLVNEGESESLFLECKSPGAPSLGMDLRKTLAKCLSGFSNTNGGVIIWGAATTKKSHSGLDVITQIEPIGNIQKFQREIENRIPTLTVPSINAFKNKIIKKKSTDTRGVLLTFIPKKSGDPVQNVEDEYFYFRSGDDFVKTPYEMLKRLFSAIDNPDLTIRFDRRLIKIDENGEWSFPLLISNQSNAVAEKIKIFVVVDNFEDCEKMSISSFQDISKINPQYKKALSYDLNDVIYKGLDQIVEDVTLKMKGKKRTFLFSITLYANKMISKDFSFKLSLVKNHFSWILIEEKNKY